MLISAGCSKEYIGSVIQMICKKAGVTVQGKMSRHTVSRAILKVELQLKFKLAMSSHRQKVST
jgi:hypothetical protein